MKRKIFFAGGFFLLAAAGSAFGQTDICIPQFLDGFSGPHQWRTMLIVQNQEQTQAQARFQFYDNDGQVMNQLRLGRRAQNEHHVNTGPGGQFDTDPIRTRAAIAYRSAGDGALKAGFCKVQSQQRLQVHARLEVRNQAGDLLSETSVIPGPAFRLGGFHADRLEGAAIGLALVNPQPITSATCEIQIFDEDGNLLGSAPKFLGPYSQTAQYLKQTFPQILTDGIGYVVISCDSPVCALALQLRGLSMLQIPVVVINN